MPIRQLLPSSIRRSVGGVCKEQPRTTKREDVRGGPRCNRLMVLMRGGVMIRGGLLRRDAMCTAGTGEHLSGLGRPRRAARGASQVPGHWQRGGQHTQGARHARTRASGRGSQGPEGAKGQTRHASVEGHAGGDGASFPSNHGGVEGAAAGVCKWGESGTVTALIDAGSCPKAGATGVASPGE